jgi:hypothetical protein
MTRLFIEPEAEAELEEAAVRYEDAVPGLGQRFVAEMRHGAPFVPAMPSLRRSSAASPASSGGW